MSYASKLGVASLYQGTSFTISLGKGEKADNLTWDANETGEFIVVDNTNAIVLTRAMIKSTDSTSLTFKVYQSDTTDWLGNYRILAFQLDSNDAEVRVPKGDYEVEYETTKAKD